MPRQTIEAHRSALTREQWRIVLLASLGGAVEYYDFVVYGVFASVLSTRFFPARDPLTSLLATYGVFAVGYLARPVGGIVLGHLGDRHGRRRVFVGSTMAMSLATALIGVLPNYSAWGRAAPLLLLALRLAQGFCLGGELSGAVTYVAETTPRRIGFACGVVYGLVVSGALLATLVASGVRLVLPPASLDSLGWRIGFLVGGGIGAVSFLIRRTLGETPAFRSVTRRRRTSPRPVLDVVSGHRRALVAGVLTLAPAAGFTSLLITYMPVYLVRVLHGEAARIAPVENIAVAVAAIGIPLVGWATDHVPRRRVLQGGAVAMLVLGIPFFLAIAGHRLPWPLLMVLFAVPAALCIGTFAATIAELYPTPIRYSGVALTANIGFALFSGTAPLVATWLIEATGWPAAPGMLVCGLGLVGLCGTVLLPRPVALAGSLWDR